jgi:SAM-dependent methyltransferase
MTSPFDDFAWFYDKHWAAGFAQWQLPALDRLFLPCVKPGARVLDLCCGTGALARLLVDRSYTVIGVDSSDGMLQFARQNVPEATFVHADASQFSLGHPVDGAISVFDSLNNIFEPDALRSAFHCVHDALQPGAFFVFDVNTSAAYGDRWDQTHCEVQPDHAFFLRGGFDAQARVGTTLVTMFRLSDNWTRSDVEIRQRPWDAAEVTPLLQQAGFKNVSCWRAIEDLQMPGHSGIGRAYFRARKPG